jgi:DNA-binding transcriptional regulator YiaG
VRVNELRQVRRGANLSQQEFARLLGVPVNTFRMWDSGLRPAPVPIVKRAREALDAFARRHELLSLEQLAKELGVHVRTLQAAARTGRLEAHFSVQSVFGRPIRSASRAAGDQFMAKHYRCFSGQAVCPLPLPIVPADYDAHVRALRRRMRLTQDALARRIGAAGKAVVYQWESKKRTPSPVLWARIETLSRTSADARRAPMSSKGSSDLVKPPPNRRYEQPAADR